MTSLIDILNDLVSFPTTENDAEALAACFDHVSQHLKQRGLVAQIHDSSGLPSLVATTQQTKRPKILLQAHLDVVPAKPAAYKLRDESGKLYGRGVFDMKFAAACYLQLVEDLKDQLDQYDFGIMLTADEEIGGANGVGYLLKQGYDAGVCVLPDGGDDWRIQTSCNGAWMVQLTAQGKAAHGSRHWEGDNAIERLINCLAKMRELFGEQDSEHSTITISRIKGGDAVNQVPHSAQATLDVRFVSPEAYQRLRRQLEAVAAEQSVRLETLAQVDVCTTDINLPEVTQFMKVAERVRGKPLQTCHSHGASDAWYFAAKDIPVIVIRPSGGGAHADDEWIDKQELLRFYELIKAYVVESSKIVA